MWTIIVSMALIGSVFAGGNNQQGPWTPFFAIGLFNECEGKDAGNYTLHSVFNLRECTEAMNIHTSLTHSGPNGQLAVNGLQTLAFSVYVEGAYDHEEVLYLVLSGNLEGKYVYRREIHLEIGYLKKCSSVLGYSYTTTKSAVILIADKLDMNVLISPTGGFEVFKRGCTTICKGIVYIV